MNSKTGLKKTTLFDIIFILALSVFSAGVFNVYKYHDFRVVGNPETIYFILFTALFFFSFIGVLFVIHVLEEKKFFLPKTEIRIFTPDIKGFLKGTLLISLCYLPVAIIFYPGVCSWDTINQLYDYLTGDMPYAYNWGRGQEQISAFLNDHHPVFDTFIYVAFYNLGQTVGNLKAGIFIYSLTCMVLTSGAFSYMICLINRLKIRLPKVPLLLFMLLMPFLAVYSFSMIKDSLFGLVFVWFFAVIIDILFNKPTRKKLVALIIVSVLLSLTKKTGVYIVVPSVFALLFSKAPSDFNYKKYIFPAFIVPAVLIFVILPKIIFPIANIWPGGKQEVFGTLFQQTARVELDKPYYYSSVEKEVIDRVFDFNHIKDNYRYEVSDGIKDTYRFYSTDGDRKAYLKVWMKTGLNNPFTYFKATAGNSGGFFAPAQTIELHKNMTEQKMVPGMDNIESFQNIRKAYINTYEFITSIPVVSLLFSNVLYAFWIPVFMIVRGIKSKKRNIIIVTIPILLSLLVLIVSPNSHIRYGIHLLYIAPMLIALGLFSKKTSDKKQDEQLEKDVHKGINHTV